MKRTHTVPPALAILALVAPLCGGSAHAFTKQIHASITTSVLKEMGYDRAAAGEVAEGNLATDDDEFQDPKAHFDNEEFSAGSTRLHAKLDAAIDAIGACRAEEAREQAGRGLHAIQDFFSHSNFIENNRPGAPIDLFHLKDPSKALICDRLTHRGPLTSGYYPDDARPSEEKCVHAELNKDGPSRPYHAAARARAREETRKFARLVDARIRARFQKPGHADFLIRLLKDDSVDGRGSAFCQPARPASASICAHCEGAGDPEAPADNLFEGLSAIPLDAHK